MNRKNLLHWFLGLSSIGVAAGLSNMRTALSQNIMKVLTVNEGEGRVGIRNNTPTYTLHVKHTNGTPEGDTPNNGLAISHDAGSTWTLYVNKSNGSLTFYRDNSYVLAIANDGKINTVSDLNRKKNVEGMSDGQLDKLLKLQLKSFQYFNQEDEKKHHGLIAQDVIKVFPEVVSNQTDDYGQDLWTASYPDLIPFLIKGVQEQHTIIEQKMLEIAALKMQQKDILSRLERLEQGNPTK